MWKKFMADVHPYRRHYLLLNVLVHGVLVAAMVVTVLNPSLYEVGMARAEAFLEAPGAATVVQVYEDGSPILIVLITFAANLSFAAFATTTLPSLIIPFAGVVTTAWRTAELGMWMAPATPDMVPGLLASLPVLLLELQAYILAALGSIVLWRSVLRHRRRSDSTAWRGYREGLAVNARLYIVIAGLLLLAAVLEAVVSTVVTPSLPT